jgi:hypothetical protein
MRKPQSVLMTVIGLAVLGVAACTGPPETQLVIVVSPTHEPPTLTALAEAQTSADNATPVSDASNTPPPELEATATTEELTTPTTESPTEPPATPTRTPSPTDSRFPTPLVTQIQVAEQSFENGRMLWLQPNREIWVIINAPDSETHGDWLIFEDTFVEGEPEYDPDITPPVDGLQPERGFGKLWRENDEVRDALGWGTTPEFGFVTTYEYRAGGYLNSDGEFVPAPGIHILISLGNEALAFEEADFTWRLIE